MTRTILLTSSARGDVADARKWYEACDPDLSLSFRDDFEHALQRAASHPGRYPAVRNAKNIRKGLLICFPYLSSMKSPTSIFWCLPYSTDAEIPDVGVHG